MSNFLENITKDLEDTIAQLTMDYFKESGPLLDIIEYSVIDGGKRLRPLLMVLTYLTYSSNWQDIKSYFTALEWIHSYSLIHDDLPSMDNDDYRRGKLTVHKKFGENLAILAGDSLLNGAAEILLNDIYTRDEKEKVYLKAGKLLINKSGVSGMISGQVKDVSGEEFLTSKEDLILMIEEKTGALFLASIYIGALLGGASKEDLEHWIIFGQSFGRAYQILDDYLDYEKDLADGRTTLSAFYTKEELKDLLHHELKIQESTLKKITVSTEGIIEFINSILKKEHLNGKN